MRKPDFFIVGAPKSGTSAMAHYLATHPDIFMARKEMHVFGQDLRFGAKFYRRDLGAYLEEFAACNDQRRAGEASVWYLFSKRAAHEIRAFHPQANIIVMLREPADMLYSLYHQFRFDGNEHLSTFERALEAEDDRRAGRRLSRQAYLAQVLVYRETARYAAQVRRYFEVFGRQRVKVVLFEDFTENPAAACRDTLEFLGVDPAAFDNECAVINSAKRTKNAALRSLMGDPLLRAAVLKLRPALPGLFFRILQRTESRLQKLNTRYEKPAPLAPETRALLRRQFEPEVEELGRLLGRDLTHWSRLGRDNAESPRTPKLVAHDHACLVSPGVS